MANWIGNEDVHDIVIHSSVVDIDKTSNGLLGRGGYGSVYSAKFNGQKVAVKMLSDDGDIPKNQRHDLQKEARRLRAASQHPNIINLMGVMMETGNYSLVLEYMHFGTSNSFIKTYDVGVPLRVQFVKQIISAMAWLHSQKPPVKHLDLKAENILINNYFNAKISDFGLSEWRTVTMAYSKTPIDRGPRCGTVTHIPPEVFRDINQKGKVEEDVYAFAITAWEIFTGDVPFKGCQNNVDLICNAVQNNQRPDLSVIVHQCPKLIVDMISLSWDDQPRNRPTFKEMEEKINPVYLALQHTIQGSIQYIRQEIRREHGESDERYECTMHFDNPSDSSPVNGQVAEVMDNTPREHDAKTCSPAQTFAESVENTFNESSLNAPDTPTAQQDTIIAVVNSERVENTSGAPRNIGLVHVPINETGQDGAVNVDPTSGTEHSGIGLSGFFSVKDKQYVPGSELRHLHGPIAQPVPTCLEESGVNGHLGPTIGADLDDMVETVGMFVTNLSTTNPELMQALVENPEALQNMMSLVQSITETAADEPIVNPRPSELTQPLTETNLRPANTCSGEAIPGTDANIGSVSVDELNASTLNSRKQMAAPVSSGQEVTSSSQAAGTVRMLPAPDQTHPGSQHSNNVVVRGNTRMAVSFAPIDQEQENQQSVIFGQSVRREGYLQPPGFIIPNVATLPQMASRQAAMPTVRPQRPFQSSQCHFGQQVRSRYPVETHQRFIQPAVRYAPQVPATIFGQSTRSNLGSVVLGQASTQPSVAGRQRTTVTQQTANAPIFGQPVPFHQQTPHVSNPPERQQHTVGHQLAQTPSPEVSQPQRQARAPVHVQSSAATSNSPTYSQPAANQANAGPGEPLVTGTRQQAPSDQARTRRQAPCDPTETGQRSPCDPAETQNRPFTISHKHVDGGFTTLTMNPDIKFPPNVQIGNNNCMVLHDERKPAKKKAKCRKSQLTTCTDELSMNHMDMVCVEIGNDWKRLCRELYMTEADIEQLQFDYHVSGLYEIMYQGIQRWVQRNGRVANVHKLALALWEIERADIALRLG